MSGPTTQKEASAISDFRYLDYACERMGDDAGPHRSPTTAAIGGLALQLRELTGAVGVVALAAAVLIDQGRVAEALGALLEHLEEVKADKAARKAKLVHPGADR